MPVLWIVEAPDTQPASLVRVLQGLYPTRVFASVASLRKLMRVAAATSPDACLILVDATHSERTTITADLKRQFPEVTCAFFAQANVKPKAEVYSLPNEAFAQIRLVESLIQPPTAPKGELQVSYRGIELYAETGTLRLPNHDEVHLTNKEAKLLFLLMKEPQKCLERATLKAAVWGKTALSPRIIDVYISRLRKHLAPTTVSITNVYGDGYSLG